MEQDRLDKDRVLVKVWGAEEGWEEESDREQGQVGIVYVQAVGKGLHINPELPALR